MMRMETTKQAQPWQYSVGGHTGKQHLPEDREEVHDVVKAGRQPLLA